MNANGRREGDITDVMRVIGTECPRLTRMYHEGLLTRTMLLKDTGRYDEGSRGLTWSWKPVDCPDSQLITQMSWSGP